MAGDGRVVIDTELNTKPAEKQAQGLGNSLKGGLVKGTKAAAVGLAAMGAAAVAAAGSVARATMKTAEHGDHIDKMSQKLGMSAKAYQQWDYVAKISGTSIDGLKMGFKTLTNTIDKANQGEKTAVENFKRVGMSIDDLKGKSKEDIFKTTVESLQKMSNETERSAMANKLLGRAGMELGPMLNSSKGSIDELMKKAEEYGMVMSDEAVKASAKFKDSLTTLQGTFEGLKNKMSAEFLPSLTKVTDGLSLVFKGDTKQGLKKIEEGIGEFTKKLNEITPKILKLGGTILKALGKGLIDNLPNLLSAGASMIGAIIKGIAQALPILIRELPKILSSIGSAFSQALGTLGTTLPSALKPLAEILKIIVDLFSGIVQAITAQNTLGAVLRSVIFSLVGAYIAYKTAVSLAAIAQGALNLVMNANPIFLVATAVAALTAALYAYISTSSGLGGLGPIMEETAAIEKRTAALQAELDTQNQISAQHEQQMTQTQENINGHIAEGEQLMLLKGQLEGLVDAQGNVQKGREAQVEFILGQLNDALGTEYKLVHGQVTEYNKLKTSIDKAIQAKTTELVLKDAEQGYTEAVRKHKEAQEAAAQATEKKKKAEQNYYAVKSKNDAILKKLEAARTVAAMLGQDATVKSLNISIAALKSQTNSAKKEYTTASELEKKRKTSSQNYYGEMIRYQAAFTARASGNNKKAQKILSDSTSKYKKLGQYISTGVANGMTDEEAMKMVSKAANIISEKGLKALKKKWNIKSPSKVAKKEIGENIGAGIALGMVEGFAENDPVKQLSSEIMASAGRLQTAINTSMDLNAGNLAGAVVEGIANSNLTVKVGEREMGRVVRSYN